MKFELIGSRNLHNKIKGNVSRQRAVHLVTYNYYNYCFYRTSAAALPGWWYCYSPVNKLPPRLATSRPLGKRSEPFLATKRPTASDEVARGWLVSLEGFAFALPAKNGEWRDSHLGFQVSFASPWLQWRNVLIPLQVNLLNVCVYLHHRRSKFVYFVPKLTTSGSRKKTRTCFNLESILGKEITQPRNPWHLHTF